MHEWERDSDPEREELGGAFDRSEQSVSLVLGLRFRVRRSDRFVRNGEGLDIETGHLFLITTFTPRII